MLISKENIFALASIVVYLSETVGSIERISPNKPKLIYDEDSVHSSDPRRPLSVRVYKVLSDAVILDWYIALSEKDRMSSCDVTYTRLDNSTDTILLSPFLPATRTFLLRPLEANQSYAFHMMCTDHDGNTYLSNLLRFVTDVEGSTKGLDFRRDLPGSLAPSYNLGAYVHQLPVSSSSEEGVGRGEGSRKRSSQFPFSIERTFSSSLNKISPHLVLGASCGVVGFIIMTITLALAGRRYSQYRSSQTRLWELQTVRDLEAATYPSFIPVSSSETNGYPPAVHSSHLYGNSLNNNNSSAVNNNLPDDC